MEVEYRSYRERAKVHVHALLVCHMIAENTVTMVIPVQPSNATLAVAQVKIVLLVMLWHYVFEAQIIILRIMDF